MKIKWWRKMDNLETAKVDTDLKKHKIENENSL